MKLNEYLEKIKKSNCPQDCEFKQIENIEIVKVPPPDEILGIIISRDPTTDWLEKYKKAKELPSDECREKLFCSAIPQQLIDRVKKFMGEKTSKGDIDCLSNVIYEKVYWTHLHKCFTDKSGKKSIKFKNKNAQKCAGKWLVEELNIAINDKTKFIIALGNDVQKWICEWREDYCKNIKVIYLPHPSAANVGKNTSWNPKAKNRERIEKRINNLLKICKTVS